MDYTLVFLVMGQFLCAAPTALHEATMFYGCSESGDGQVQIHWNGDQILYADFKAGQAVWTAPLLEELENVLSPGFYILALVSKERLLKYYLRTAMEIEKSPTEEKAPAILMYPQEEEEQGKENTLYCYISHFYPPDINVTWTKNGVQVTEGAALSNLIPEGDGSFSRLASLSVRPETGDVLGCSVQHQALREPATATWALPIRSRSSAAAWLCLCLGFVCLTAGVCLLVLSAKPSLRNQLLDGWQATYHRVAQETPETHR